MNAINDDRSEQSLLGPLKNKSFFLVWFSQTISAIGDAILPMALAVKLVRSGAGAQELGFIFAARGIAMVLILLLGGVLADRLPRARVMLGSDIARLILVLWGVAIIPRSTESQLVALMFFFGLAEALFRPAYRSIAPALLPPAKLKSANALIAVSVRTVGVIGPALAGSLVLIAGIQNALLVDAATFIISICALAFVREPSRVAYLRPTVGREMSATLGLIKKKPWIVSQMIAGLVQMPLAVAPWFVLLPIVAAERFHSVESYGVVLSIYAVGGIVGGTIGARWNPSQPGTVAMFSVALFALPLLSLALGVSIIIVWLAHFLGGLGLELYGVYWYTALQRSVSGDFLGKVVSIDMLAGTLLMPAAYGIVGPTVRTLGQQNVLYIGAISCVLTTIPLLILRENRMFSDLATSE